MKIILAQIHYSVLLFSPLLYLALLAMGRALKKRTGISLGISYQAFCFSLAILAPLTYTNIQSPALLNTVAAITTLLGTLFVLEVINRFFWDYYFKGRLGSPVPKFLREIVSFLIFVVVLVTVLWAAYDIKIPGLLAGSGILAVIIGLAMQDLLGNVIAGFALQFGKPFRVGDWLFWDNRHAEVMEINWRSTRLCTNDNIFLDIPNSKLAKETIINLNYPDGFYAMHLVVGIDYETPPNQVKEILWQAASTAPGVLAKPEPKVLLLDFGDSALTYEVKFWLEDHSRYSEITDAIRTNIWYGLRRHHIKIPYPIRTLQIERHRASEPSAEKWPAVRDILARQDLFSCLDDPLRETLARRSKQSTFGSQEKIIQQGAEGSSMFMLLSGKARVVIERDGHLTSIAHLQAGDCFGEMSLLTGEKRSATVIAETDCQVSEIEKATLGDILMEKPGLLEKLSELLAKRRFESEALLDQATSQRTSSTQKEYVNGFIKRLREFFGLHRL